MLQSLEQCGITVKLYNPDDALEKINPKSPRVYISLGPEWSEFTTLNSLPLYERKRWLHYTNPEEIQSYKLFNCWLTYTDPLPQNRTIPYTQFSADNPLVSVFTASYKSKKKIQRPYRSLLKQTYSNWEWVIVDDSDDEEETYQQFLTSIR